MNYNLDNEGSGFNLDDEDFGAMLDAASAASEEDEDGATQLESESAPKKTARRAAKQEPEVEVVTETAPEDVETEDDFAFDFEEPAEAEPEPAPPAPAPVRRPRVGTPVAARRAPREEEPKAAPQRIQVPSEADRLREVSRVITVLDVYRSLSPKEKNIAVQFITNSNDTSADDATVVVKAINADPHLMPTMRALYEAYECESVERAFYVMGLDPVALRNLGELVAVFTHTEYDAGQDDLALAREIVAGIATLDAGSVNDVKATESVLAAAKGQDA